MGSSIVRINDTGVDTLCVIWVNDSDEYLSSSTADSNQNFVEPKIRQSKILWMVGIFKQVP